VTSDDEHPDEDQDDATHADGHPIQQSDKPRAGIAAEYLAKGYSLSDQILQRAIDMDNRKGISKRFLSYFNNLDSGIGQRALGPDQTLSSRVQTTLSTATERVRAVDEQRGISKTANDYYSKAISSPFGQKVLAFYTNTSKQVRDIHEEARRIVDTEKPHSPTSAPEAPPVMAAPASGGVAIPVASDKKVDPNM